MKRKSLVLQRETLRTLGEADLVRVGGGVPTANVSAENVSCCSFDAPCATETCATRRGSCRLC